MANTFDIFMGSEAVGTASLEKEGLYWKIRCCCDLSGDVVHKVIVMAGEEIDLGILVREGNAFCLTKRIPMKRFGDVQPRFTVKPRTPKTQRSFQPITPDEPFSYIEKLKESYLEEKNGEVGISLPAEDPALPIPDSDPSRESPDESAPE